VRDFDPAYSRFGSKPEVTAPQHGRPLHPNQQTLTIAATSTPVQGKTLSIQPDQRTAFDRSLLTAGALAVIRYAKIYGTKHRFWLTALLAPRSTKVAAIALANRGENAVRNPSYSQRKRGWDGEQHVMQSRSIR
jgi:hypothetical protein